MKTYGTITLSKGKWVICAEPHVELLLKRVFPKIGRRQHGTLTITDTPEVARDLCWFAQRYPMTVPDAFLANYMKEQAAKHKQDEILVDRLLSGVQKASDFELAIPPREYQRVAADMCITKGGLLDCDELGLGKQNPVDTMVLTPSGYRQLGEIRVGDFVIGSSGKAVLVKGVFPQGIKPSYRVWFHDGSSVEAGPEHLWTAYYFGCRDKYLYEVTVTTEQIRTGATIIQYWPHPRRPTTKTNLGGKRLLLPMLRNPVQFERADELPLPPYLMGQLIAQGSLAHHGSCIVVGTKDADHVMSRLYLEEVVLGAINVNNNATKIGIPGISQKIRDLGLAVLSGQKRIPRCYLTASIADRITLLNSLMDGDGSVSSKQSRLTYSTTSEGLANDVRELVECLAGVASVRSYDRSAEGKGVEFSVRIRPPEMVAPFSLPRKMARYSPSKRINPTRSFDRIEYIRDVESVCISVEADDQLFAVEHAILTHNSAIGICILSRAIARPALVVTMTHLTRQWQSELKKFAPQLRTHIIQKGTPYDLVGTKKTRKGQMMLTAEMPDVIIMNYHKLSGWAATLGRVMKGKAVVFDEAAELRHTGTARYTAAKHISENAGLRLLLTATPIYNYGDEIWNLINISMPGALGSKIEFLEMWCTRQNSRGQASLEDPKAFGSYARAAGLMLRRTRKDVGRELPDLTHSVQFVDSDTEELDKIVSPASELARRILAQGPSIKGEQFRASGQLDMLVRQATGIAKCLATGTLVRMFDGSLKQVENICVGDVVMGPDSKQRRVVETTSGTGELYRISSTYRAPLFEPYIVNSEHVLALKHTGVVRHGDRYLFGPYLKDEHLEITVGDYLKKSKHFKRMVKGFKTGVEFVDQELPLDPYFLGLWLGDGTSKHTAVTTADPEIREYLYAFAERNCLKIRVQDPNRTAPTYHITPGIRGGNISPKHKNFVRRNGLRETMKSLGVIGNKHIPQQYLVNSRRKRMQLLAGLIDSDGHLNKPSGCGYTIVSKWEHLANEIRELACSLGLAAKVRSMIARNQNGNSFIVFRVLIYGEHLEDLPVLIPRKRAIIRKQKKNALVSGISVTPVGVGGYHGFTLDGDGLFLLKDYTVTHNSAYVAKFVRMLVESEEPVVLYGWHRSVYDIWMEQLKDLHPVLFTGSESANQKEESKRKFVSGETRLIIMSLRSGAGLDGLQMMCRTVCYGELDWSPSVHDQGTGRVHRDMQTQPVVAYYLISAEGSDPIISDVLGLKKAQSDGLKNIKNEQEVLQDTGGQHVRKLAEHYLKLSHNRIAAE